jgi:hypothetical protein
MDFDEPTRPREGEARTLPVAATSFGFFISIHLEFIHEFS